MTVLFFVKLVDQIELSFDLKSFNETELGIFTGNNLKFSFPNKCFSWRSQVSERTLVTQATVETKM